jgi:hypothetical protein
LAETAGERLIFAPHKCSLEKGIDVHQ